MSLHLLRARARRRRQRQSADAHAAIAASGVGRLIQRSAASVYADGGHVWLDEASPVMPSAPIRNCVDAEAAAVSHAGRGGTADVLRLGAVYGPDDLMTRAIIRTARRGWQPFDGPRDAYRPTVSGHDAAAAVIRALHVPPGSTPYGQPSAAPTKSTCPARSESAPPGTSHRWLDCLHQRAASPRRGRPGHALKSCAGL